MTAPRSTSQSGPGGHTPVAATLRELAADGATARLVIAHDDLQAGISLRDGRVSSASAPGARARLGDRLVAAHTITQEQLDAALQRQREHPASPRLGEVLLELELIDTTTLGRVLSDQAIDSIAMAIGWPGPAQRVEAGGAGDEDVAVSLSAENALVEATRRLDEWSALGEALGSLDARVAVVPDAPADLVLTPDERAILARIDGRRSVLDLAEDTGYSGFRAARIVYSLLSTGVVALLAEPGAAGEPPDLAMPAPPARPHRPDEPGPPPSAQADPPSPAPASSSRPPEHRDASADSSRVVADPEGRRALTVLLSQLVEDAGGADAAPQRWRFG